MAKIILKKTSEDIEKKYSIEEVKEFLSEAHACYVLVTCSEPSKGGKMQVEMSYDGDEVLASYLLQSAQDIFEEKMVPPLDSIEE